MAANAFNKAPATNAFVAPSFLGAMQDPGFWKSIGRNASSVGNRAALMLAGAPADMANLPVMLKRAVLGQKQTRPVFGSEHLMELAEKHLGSIVTTGNPTADLVGDLATGALTMAPQQTAALAQRAAATGAKNLAAPTTLRSEAGVIKTPGGNWLSPRPEGVDGGLVTEAPEFYLKQSRSRSNTDPLLDTWIDKQLTRYVKNDMGTQNDPVRALAERGILHIGPDALAVPIGYGKDLRPGQTAPAVSDLAKRWDYTVDQHLPTESAGGLLRKTFDRDLRPAARLEHNAWLAKVPPDTPVHLAHKPYNIGFTHLIDELRNATNPASGLPAHLQLKPESLAQVSVPQAVERVAKINAWRAANKADTNKALANNEATFLHKDYPEQGLSWRQLRQPEGATNQASLQAALKYEGDTMGHCVGGYCSSVAAGDQQIFSLRDAKGEPHVTIEVEPIPNGMPSILQIKGKGNGAPAAKYLPAVQDFIRSGDWLSVGDIRNAGMMGPKDLQKAGITPAGARLLRDVLPRFYTRSEFDIAVEGLKATPNAFNK